MADNFGPAVSIGLLGPVIVRTNGDEAEVRGDRQQRLLTALALQPGGLVTVDKLTDIVWPDGDEPPDPRSTLHTYVYRLRRTLGSNDLVEAVEGGYRLDRTVQIDWDLFEEAIESTTDLDRSDEEIIATADAALAMWRAAPVERFADEEWVRPRVVRLEEQRVRAIIVRSTALLRAGRPGDAIPLLEQSIHEAPYHEGLQQILMQALHDAGRSADALRAFQVYRRRMSSELGLEPGDSIVALERRIVSGGTMKEEPVPVPQVGSYELGRRIGDGAYATVYLGRQPSLDRDVAIKVIRPELANRPSFIRRFEAEAQLVAGLEHPHIVPLHDYWREPGAAYLVMRHLGGGTLEDRLAHGPVPWRDALELADQVAQGLAAAHRHGVVHRDVKPANILLDDTGRVYVSDFGIALISGDQAGFTGGSPVWSPPELLRNEPVEPATDVYGLGLILHTLLTGRRPFLDATNTQDLRRRQLHEPLRALHGEVPGVEPWIDELIAAATEKAVDKRLPDADAFLAALRSQQGRVAVEASTAFQDATNPFKGLEPFRETDAADFHGRERVVAQVLDILGRGGTDGRLVAVIGPSGSGKSSAVRAGVVPALRAGALAGSTHWFIASMVPSRKPFEELEVALSRIAGSPLGSIAEDMLAAERGIARAVRQALPDDSSEALLVIDQFEELFTLVDSEEDRERFVHGLLDAVSPPSSRLRVIVTVRADFWDRPLRHPDLAHAFEGATVSVGPMTGDEVERAVVRPARAQGVELEPGLAARIVSDMSGQPNALPLLQYTLTELFERRRDGVIPADAYDEMGGLTGAIARRADGILTSLDRDAQAAARQMFTRLVAFGDGGEDVRRRVIRAELGTGEPMDRCVDAFGNARLLAFDRDAATRQQTVEVAHEALLSEWPRLRDWIDQDRDVLRVHRDITRATAAWLADDRLASDLWRGARLEVAEDVTDGDRVELNEDERAFVAASAGLRRAEHDREQRSRRRLRGLALAVSVVAVLALVAGVLAWQQRNDAHDARRLAEARAEDAENAQVVAENQRQIAEEATDKAEVERARAETARMAGEAPTRAWSDLQLGLLLAAEAYSRDPSPRTLGALQQTLLEAGPVLGHLGRSDARYLDVAWVDGGTVVALDANGVEIIAVDGSRTTAVPLDVETSSLREETFGAMALSLDGSRVAVATTEPSVAVISTATGAVETLAHEHPVSSLAFHPKGHELATGDRSGTVRRWVLATGDMTSFTAHTELIADFEPRLRDSRFDWDGSEAFWGDGLSQLDFGVANMAYSADGRKLATIGHPLVRIWDTATEELDTELLALQPVPSGAVGMFPAIGLGFTADATALELRTPWQVAAFALETGELSSVSTYPTDRAANDLNINAVDAERLPTGEIAVYLNDGRVRVHAAGESPSLTVPVQLDRPAALAVSPDGRRVVAAGGGGLAVVALDGGTPLATAIALNSGANAVTMSGDGRLVAERSFVAGGGVVHELRPDGYGPAADLGDLVGTNVAVVPTPNGVLLGTFDLGSLWQTWHDATGAELFGHEGGGGFVGFSPDGRWMASPEWFRHIVIRDPATGSEIARLTDVASETAFGEFVRVSFSADSTQLVATSAELNAIWDTSTWELARPVGWFGDAVRASFSPDGRFLATVLPSGTVQVRDAQSHEVLRLLEGGAPPVPTLSDVSWSADGSLLLTEFEAAPRLFDAETGEQIGDAFPSAPATNHAAVSGAPMQLATIVGGSALVWNLDTDQWADVACRVAGRSMTQEEWNRFGPQGEKYRQTCPARDT